MRKFHALTASFLLIIAGCSTDDEGTTIVVPAAPSNLTATVISTTQVNLAWTDNSTNEGGYKVQRKTGGGSFADIATTGPDISTYSDTGLTPNTTYTYRVYAYNSAGNSLQYSNEVTVTTNAQSYSYTSGPNVTDIDGNIYSSITTSCGQTWTSKNLTVSRYRNGDVIPQAATLTQMSNLTTGAWCYLNNDPATEPIYGRLYNWYAVNDSRGIAPQGWHIPTDAEWNKLTKCIDPNADTSDCCNNIAGGAMKTTTVWNPPNIGATNNSGFSGLPDIGGNYGAWWSSTEVDTENAWTRLLTFGDNYVGRSNYNKKVGYSVRVLKN